MKTETSSIKAWNELDASATIPAKACDEGCRQFRLIELAEGLRVLITCMIRLSRVRAGLVGLISIMFQFSFSTCLPLPRGVACSWGA